MIDERQAVRVGAITLVVLGAAITAIIGLDRIELGDRVRFEVEFEHVGALQAGADVQIAGRDVGQVESIRLAERGAVARVSIEERYARWAPANAELFIASKGVIGKRYLAIGPPPEGEAPRGRIEDGDRLRGISPVQIQSVILRSIENTARFRELLIEVRPAARQLAAELSETAELLAEIEPEPGAYAALAARGSRLVDQAALTRERLEAAGLTGARLGALADRAGDLGARLSAELAVLDADLDAVMADVNQLRDAVPASSMLKLRMAIDEARTFGDQLDRIAGKVEMIAAAVERGEGTIGALLNDPEFINDAKKLGKIIKRHPWRLLGTDRPKKAPERRP